MLATGVLVHAVAVELEGYTVTYEVTVLGAQTGALAREELAGTDVNGADWLVVAVAVLKTGVEITLVTVELAGQSVTVDAQEVMVMVLVWYRVEVPVEVPRDWDS